MSYWLMKSEPEAFSIEDLQQCTSTAWDGIRNYQVRNMMRDQMHTGDLAFFYHSNCKPPGIVGIMEIISQASPDLTAFDPHDDHFDPKSNPAQPCWLQVDVRFKEKFKKLLSLDDIRRIKALADLKLLQKGNRLSVIPLTKEQWNLLLKHARES